MWYQYDTYEPDQTLDVDDSATNPLGRLVSIRDRAAHSRMNFDARGRVTRTSRQMAKPSPVPDKLRLTLCDQVVQRRERL